jgi:hypothetical protein
MPKILIVSNFLIMGGAEKLIFELASFAMANNIEPTVLILDNYNLEYYDGILEKTGVRVVRTRIRNIKHFRAPLKMIRSLIWKLKLRYYADKYYESVHVMGLYNIEKVFRDLVHPHRYFWNLNNAVQFNDEIYPVSADYFKNPQDKVVCINKYQQDEMHKQYGVGNIRSELLLFNLFMKMNGAD